MAYYRVLVVDDNREVRRMVAASIKTLGAEIDVLDVPSAEEGMYISTSLPLDLVVLDHRLPGMTGIEMVSKLKSRKPEMKIILVSGVEDETIRKKIAQAEVEAYFYKPIDINSFLEAVRRSLWTIPAAPGVLSVKKAQTGKLPVETPEPPKLPAIPQTAPSDAQPLPPAPPAFNETKYLHPFALIDRMTALQLQVKADGAVIVSLDGHVQAEVGESVVVTADAFLLSSLIQACVTNMKVLQAISVEDSECMQYFTFSKRCIYATLVGMNHALLVTIPKRVMADKLGMVDRAIHLASQDLNNLLAGASGEKKPQQTEPAPKVEEPAPKADIDQQPQTGLEGMFAETIKIDNKQQVEDFWQTLEDNGELEVSPGDESFSYEQARDMGLIPDQK